VKQQPFTTNVLKLMKSLPLGRAASTTCDWMALAAADPLGTLTRTQSQLNDAPAIYLATTLVMSCRVTGSEKPGHLGVVSGSGVGGLPC